MVSSTSEALSHVSEQNKPIINKFLTDFCITNTPTDYFEKLKTKVLNTQKLEPRKSIKKTLYQGSDNEMQLFLLKDRVNFISPEGKSLGRPTFASAFFCRNFLPKDICCEGNIDGIQKRK